MCADTRKSLQQATIKALSTPLSLRLSLRLSTPQFVQFLAYFILFLAYMSVAVYGNDPSWTTSELIAHPQGRAALALECILMIMMFGQVCKAGGV